MYASEYNVLFQKLLQEIGFRRRDGHFYVAFNLNLFSEILQFFFQKLRKIDFYSLNYQNSHPSK